MENKIIFPDLPSKIIHDALSLAASLIGTKETKPNEGEFIDDIQKAFGFHKVAYCVLFCLYCYKVSMDRNDFQFNLLKTASSQSLFEFAKSKGYVYTDTQLIKPGDIVIWRKFKLWQGHAGLITSFLEYNHSGQKLFSTIEGNTSNSNYGSQSDGDGIYKRIRYCNKLDFDVDGFYLRGFIDMRKVIES